VWLYWLRTRKTQNPDRGTETSQPIHDGGIQPIRAKPKIPIAGLKPIQALKLEGEKDGAQNPKSRSRD